MDNFQPAWASGTKQGVGSSEQGVANAEQGAKRRSGKRTVKSLNRLGERRRNCVLKIAPFVVSGGTMGALNRELLDDAIERLQVRTQGSQFCD